MIRVNSQSGKGGIAYLLETEYGIVLPRRLQIGLARKVQLHTDEVGTEVTASDVWRIFQESYMSYPAGRALGLARFDIEGHTTSVTLEIDGTQHASSHQRLGPVEALTAALAAVGPQIEILSLHQTSVESGNSADALTAIEYRQGENTGWAVSRDQSALMASLQAVLVAASRLERVAQ